MCLSVCLAWGGVRDFRSGVCVFRSRGLGLAGSLSFLWSWPGVGQSTLKRPFQQLPLKPWPHQLRAPARPGAPRNHHAPKTPGAPKQHASVAKLSRPSALGGLLSSRTTPQSPGETHHPSQPEAARQQQEHNCNDWHALPEANEDKLRYGMARKSARKPAITFAQLPLSPQSWTQCCQQMRIAARAQRVPRNAFPGHHDQNKR